MSIDNCDHCGYHVDTDDDAEFYIEVPDSKGRPYDRNWKGLCQQCRKLYIDELEVK